MRPLIIVGAPRSGTNALRDALCMLDAFHTWPCDELNPLWRTDNTDWPTDALPAERATPVAMRRIRGSFARQAARASSPQAMLVEKTCANTLRLPFVSTVFPDAFYVEIVRDGRDAASSTAERWGASFDLGYTLRKARFVPPGDLADLVRRQVRNRLVRSDHTPGATVKAWGPVFDGLDRLCRSNPPVIEIAAQQWSACTGAQDDFFSSRPEINSIRLRYEEFVAAPGDALAQICEAAGRQATTTELSEAARSIHAGSVGKWRTSPLVAAWPEFETYLRPRLNQLGYRTEPS